jgi:hypothetical protein
VVRALVSGSAVTAVIRAHLDQAYDAARRLGCDAREAEEVARLAAHQLIDDLKQQPESVRDLVGGFLARVREHAEVVRLARRVPTGSNVEQALGLLSDGDRFALLTRDSYDLTVHQAAVALGVDGPESARTVALARLALVAAVDGTPPISLAGHDIALGDLGQLADGSAPPGGRFAAVRRHVSGCAQCAAVLTAETRATAMIGTVGLQTLPDANREAIIASAARHAADVLPTDVAVQRELDEGSERQPILNPLLVISVLLGALLIGGIIGALIASNSSGGPSNVTVPTTSTAAPTDTATPTQTSPATTGSPTLTVITSTAPPPTTPPPTRPTTPPPRSITPTPTRTGPAGTTTPTPSPPTH